MVFFVVFVVARAAAALLEERGWFVVGVVLANDDWFEDVVENVFFYC